MTKIARDKLLDFMDKHFDVVSLEMKGKRLTIEVAEKNAPKTKRDQTSR